MPRQSLTYAEAVVAELDAITESFVDILRASGIQNIDPNRNRRQGGTTYIGFAKWGWTPSNASLEAARMSLLERLHHWEPRYRMLFPHPTPAVRKRLDSSIERLRRWLLREGRSHDVPPTIARAEQKLRETVKNLRSLIDLLPPDQYAARLVVDTNAPY